MSLKNNSHEARFCYLDSVYTPEMITNLNTSAHRMLINGYKQTAFMFNLFIMDDSMIL